MKSSQIQFKWRVRISENIIIKTDHSGKGTNWKKCSWLGVWELEGVNNGISVQISAEALRNFYSLKKKQKSM